MCCDELAVSLTGRPDDYAETLEFVARRRFTSVGGLLSTGFGTGDSNMTLLNRVHNVLGLNLRNPSVGLWPAGLLTLFVPSAIWMATAGVLPPTERQALAADDAATEKVSAKEIRKLDHSGGGVEFGKKVYAVAYSPDGDTLVSTTKQVHLWDDGGKVKTYSDPPQGDFVGGFGKFGVAFSPDGKTLAVCDGKFGGFGGPIMTARLSLFDISLVKKNSLDTSQNSSMEVVVYSPDGSLLVAGTHNVGTNPINGKPAIYSDGAVLVIYDARNGTLITEIEEYKYDKVRAIAFSPNGKILATGNQARVTLRDPKTGEPLKVLKEAVGGMGLSFSPDGMTLAVANRHNVVQLFDVKSGNLKKTLKHDEGAWMKAVAFSPDGKLLVTAGSAGFPKIERKNPPQPAPTKRSVGAVLQLWDATTGKLVQRLSGHDLQVNSVAFSPRDPNHFATASDDGTVRVWHITREKE